MKPLVKNIKMMLAIVLIVLMLLTCGCSAIQAVAYQQGSTGEQVRQIQQLLKDWGYYFGKVDGIFGSATKGAVLWFQRKHGITVDGIVGNQTAEKLGITLTQSGYNSNDVYLLARLVYGESRGESYTGKVAVAAVVLNRVSHSSFPNTIASVIYQSGAFTVVSDGQINLTPDQSALSAARDALNGWDPSGNALFYYNPQTATSTWIRSREVIVTIGNHRFCK